MYFFSVCLTTTGFTHRLTGPHSLCLRKSTRICSFYSEQQRRPPFCQYRGPGSSSSDSFNTEWNSPGSESVSVSRAPTEPDLKKTFGDGGSSNGDGSIGNRRFDRGDSSDKDERYEILNGWLRDRGIPITNIEQELVTAFCGGKVGLNVISNFIHAQSSWIGRLFMKVGSGMKGRLLADRLFLLKVGIEEAIGVAGKLSAEYKVRRENFWREQEYVLPNLLSAILADFALVYFPAPSIALTGGGSARWGPSWITSFGNSFPTNVFQVNRPFTMGQRIGGFFFKASQLFLTGFSCFLISALLSNTLIAIRKRLDPHYKSEVETSGILGISSMYGIFLGVSSGTRYQIINGIEAHVFPRLFGATPPIVEKVSTFLLRYANTFEGSREWARFAQFTGLQKSIDDK